MSKLKKKLLLSFTLIELLIVIGILSILVVTILITLNPGLANKKARDVKRKKDLSTLQAALEAYSTDKGSYPSTGGAWWGGCSNFGGLPYTGPSAWIPDLAPQYIQSLPHMPGENTHINASSAGAPCPGTNTCYLYRSNVAEYKLLAHCALESGITVLPSDPYYDPTRPSWALQVSSSTDVQNSW